MKLDICCVVWRTLSGSPALAYFLFCWHLQGHAGASACQAEAVPLSRSALALARFHGDQLHAFPTPASPAPHLLCSSLSFQAQVLRCGRRHPAWLRLSASLGTPPGTEWHRLVPRSPCRTADTDKCAHRESERCLSWSAKKCAHLVLWQHFQQFTRQRASVGIKVGGPGCKFCLCVSPVSVDGEVQS